MARGVTALTIAGGACAAVLVIAALRPDTSTAPAPPPAPPAPDPIGPPPRLAPPPELEIDILEPPYEDPVDDGPQGSPSKGDRVRPGPEPPGEVAPISTALGQELGVPVAVVRAVWDALRAAEGAGSYPGQFAGLQAHGRDGVIVLIAFARAYRDELSADNTTSLLAVQALADVGAPGFPGGIGNPRVIAALEELYGRATAATSDAWRYELARALFRCGRPAAIEAEIARLESIAARGTALRVTNLDAVFNLGHRYLHADRFADAVRTFRSLAERSSSYWGNALYNAACANARAGNTAAALADLRAAILPTQSGATAYEDAGWMQADGDLQGLRSNPEFDYLVACCWARAEPSRIIDGNDPHRREMLAALSRAASGGYRVLTQPDRTQIFGDLQGDPEFERIWARLLGGR